MPESETAAERAAMEKAAADAVKGARLNYGPELERMFRAGVEYATDHEGALEVERDGFMWRMGALLGVLATALPKEVAERLEMSMISRPPVSLGESNAIDAALQEAKVALAGAAHVDPQGGTRKDDASRIRPTDGPPAVARPVDPQGANPTTGPRSQLVAGDMSARGFLLSERKRTPVSDEFVVCPTPASEIKEGDEVVIVEFHGTVRENIEQEGSFGPCRWIGLEGGEGAAMAPGSLVLRVVDSPRDHGKILRASYERAWLAGNKSMFEPENVEAAKLLAERAWNHSGLADLAAQWDGEDS